MIAILVLILSVLMGGDSKSATVVIPPMPKYSPAEYAEEFETLEWDDFWWDSYEDNGDVFTALFNSYEVKRAKNGAMMIRSGNTGSFKFARKS